MGAEYKENGRIIYVNFKVPHADYSSVEVPLVGAGQDAEAEVRHMNCHVEAVRWGQCLFSVRCFAEPDLPDDMDFVASSITSSNLKNISRMAMADPLKLQECKQLEEVENLFSKLVESALRNGETVENLLRDNGIGEFLKAIGVNIEGNAVLSLRRVGEPKTVLDRQRDRASRIAARLLKELYGEEHLAADTEHVSIVFVTELADSFLSYITELNKPHAPVIEHEIPRGNIIQIMFNEIERHPTCAKDIWKIFETLWAFYVPNANLLYDTRDDVFERLGRPNAKKVRGTVRALTSNFCAIQYGHQKEDEVLALMLNNYREWFTREELQLFGTVIVEEIRKSAKYWKLDDFFMRRLTIYFARHGILLVA